MIYFLCEIFEKNNQSIPIKANHEWSWGAKQRVFKLTRM